MSFSRWVVPSGLTQHSKVNVEKAAKKAEKDKAAEEKKQVYAALFNGGCSDS